ncbi:hypothetical protein D3C79_869500 [compost metagenome]
MQPLANAQVHAFAVDADHLRSDALRQARELDIMGNGIGVIAVHVFNHAQLSLASERIAQAQVINPVDRTKAADVTVAHRLEHPEVEIVGFVVVARFREIAVIALGSSFNHRRLIELLRIGQNGQTTNGLHVFSVTLAHQQRTFGIFLQVMGVLGDPADQNQRIAVGIQAVRHH